MERRDFLKHGAVGASGLAATGRVELTPVTPAAAASSFAEAFDRSFARIEQWPLAATLPGFIGDVETVNHLGRRSMQALFTAGLFRDLPVEGQLDPRVQDRLWSAQPLLDEAADEMTRFLESQSPARLERIRGTLRTRPEVLEGIIATLEEEVARSGISAARRAQLSTVMRDIGWRLGHQPPGLLVEEYLDKAERAIASDITTEVRQRWLTARLSEEAFWQAQESARDRRMSRGLRLMGIGALLFAGGLALVAIGENSDVLMVIGLVPGITGGAVTFIVGLIILLVGAGTPNGA
jgi:hypothetical protein